MRKLINLSPAQAAWLLRESKRLGISANEFLRRVIDKARGEL